jgi:hypothetical protein
MDQEIPIEDMTISTAAVAVEDFAKPAYQSTTILALVAGLLIGGFKMLGLFPDLTEERLTEFLIFASPIAIAIWGRLRATTSLTAGPLPRLDPSTPSDQFVSIRGRAGGSGTALGHTTIILIGVIVILGLVAILT